MSDLMSQWFDFSAMLDLWDPQGLIYLVVILLVFYLGKLVNDALTPYDLNDQLTTVDNKAIAVSFSGYLLGLSIILWGVLGGDRIPADARYEQVLPFDELLQDLLNTAIWCVVGIVLLQLVRIINDKLLLSEFSNVKELVTDKNVGTGAVQCGAYIGSALIIRAALSGEDEISMALSVIDVLVYFFVGQILFIVFAKLYQAVTRYDLHGEIEKDNVAAGVSFAATLIAVGIVLSGYIVKYDSLPGLFGWFLMSAFLLLTCRYIVDKILLPGALLDEEISKDHNWGAALVEGSSAIGLALLLNVSF